MRIRHLAPLFALTSACGGSVAIPTTVPAEELPCRVVWSSPNGATLYAIDTGRDTAGRPTRTLNSLSGQVRELTWTPTGHLARDVTIDDGETTTVELGWDARGLLAYERWKEPNATWERKWTWEGEVVPLPKPPLRTVSDDQFGPGMPYSGLPPLLAPFHGEARAGEHVARYDQGRLIGGTTGEGSKKQDLTLKYDTENHLVEVVRSRDTQTLQHRTWSYDATGRWEGQTLQLGTGAITNSELTRGDDGRLKLITMKKRDAVIREAEPHYVCTDLFMTVP